MLLALDPGLNRSGVALFKYGRLVRAERIDVPKTEIDIAHRCMFMANAIAGKFREVTDVVAEWPRTYRAGRAGGGPSKALFPLAGVVIGVAVGLQAPIVTYEPRDWAGQVPKTKTVDGRESMRGRRIGKRLDVAERAVWVTMHDRGNHDIVDAIGIGLHHLGRGFV